MKPPKTNRFETPRLGDLLENPRGDLRSALMDGDLWYPPPLGLAAGGDRLLVDCGVHWLATSLTRHRRGLVMATGSLGDTSASGDALADSPCLGVAVALLLCGLGMDSRSWGLDGPADEEGECWLAAEAGLLCRVSSPGSVPTVR